MSWLKKLVPARIQTDTRRRSVPEGLWSKCPGCDQVLYQAELERNLSVCPKCGHHLRIGARERIDGFLDPEPRAEIGAEVTPVDALRFKDSVRYKDRIAKSQKATGEKDALIAMKGELKGLPIVVVAFEFKFMGGSMGSVVGERFVRAAQVALDDGIPLICFAASGGARMQEALFSLMQMAKTSAAGPRVIQQTVRETLPEGFQRSEFLLEHGAVDIIIDRRELRDRLASLLTMLTRKPAPPDDAAEQ